MKIIYAFILWGLSVFSLSALDGKWMSGAVSWNTDRLEEYVRQIRKDIRKDRDNAELLSRAGLCYHQLAQFSNKNAQDSIDYFEKSLNLKDDGLSRVFLGSAYTLLGGEKSSLGDLNKGLAIIDQAVIENPDNPDIRFVRLSNGVASSMPYFIFNNRKSILQEDIDRLLAYYSGDTGAENMLSQIYYEQALYLMKQDDLQAAVDLWNRIVVEYPGTAGALDSQEELTLYDNY